MNETRRPKKGKTESSCSCMLHLDELPWKLFIRLMHARHPVRRGLVTQEFIARIVWEDWNAMLGHGSMPDIFIGHDEDKNTDLDDGLAVEVKYFYWDPQNFRRTVKQALRQYRGFVPRLVLVSLVMIYPTLLSRTQHFYMLMDKIRIGVVICDMAEVTERILRPRPWKEILQELLAQLPPDHEMAGITPEEFAEEYQRYYMRKLYDVYQKHKQDQERIKQDQERIKQDQERIKQDLAELKEKQDRMERYLEEILSMLKKEKNMK